MTFFNHAIFTCQTVPVHVSQRCFATCHVMVCTRYNNTEVKWLKALRRGAEGPSGESSPLPDMGARVMEDDKVGAVGWPGIIV